MIRLGTKTFLEREARQPRRLTWGGKFRAAIPRQGDLQGKGGGVVHGGEPRGKKGSAGLTSRGRTTSQKEAGKNGNMGGVRPSPQQEVKGRLLRKEGITRDSLVTRKGGKENIKKIERIAKELWGRGGKRRQCEGEGLEKRVTQGGAPS